MTVAEFIGKWRNVALTERASAQTHFNDLCRLVGHPDPITADRTGATFTFERGASIAAGGGEGWADVWKKGFFAFEYKKRDRDLDAAYLQLLRYQGALENPPLLVTCDTDRIVIHTHFSNTPTLKIELTLEGLAEPEQFATLRAVFHDPERLKPNKTIQRITEEAAEKVTNIAQGLRSPGRGIEPERVARFLDRIVFCLFAEDVNLLPNKVFTRVVENTQGDPDRFKDLVGDLFTKMATGGDFGAERIDYFNGNLFDATEVLDVTAEELRQLRDVSLLDWSNIDASIFGTLFERALDPDKRTQLGAHYTSREDIELLVDPVVMQPLRQEWAGVRASFDEALVTARLNEQLTGPERAQATRAFKAAGAIVREFLDRLATVTVLDPACGSGNFLFITLQKLKDLEKEVIIHASTYFPFFPQVGPWQLRGIEVSPYAHELAQMTVWIGHLQWHDRNGMPLSERPILRPMTNFERKDAILEFNNGQPSEPTWPAADFIVSNPPFLGRGLLREHLGDDYVNALYSVWDGRVPGEADYCCYWFEKSRASLQAGHVTRVGLLATQAIRRGASNEVLSRINSTASIFFAVSDRQWLLNGAAVRVSMVGFETASSTATPKMLDGRVVAAINSDLSAGVDLTAARTLSANLGLCFQGPVKVGDFDITFEQARHFLGQPTPHGRPNSDVVRPWLNGGGITGRNPHKFIIDFAERSEAEAALFEDPFNHVETHVKAGRLNNTDRQRRERWWQLGRSGGDLREAVSDLAEVVCTVRVAKHRLFVCVPSATLPDARLYAFAFGKGYELGVIHSRPHEVWTLAKAPVHGDGAEGGRPTYSVEFCFETFPFPDASPVQQNAIAQAVARLVELRGAWLNPPALVMPDSVTFPATDDGPWRHEVVAVNPSTGIGTVTYTRQLPVDDTAKAELKKRTLTKLYNANPAWLRDAHRALDEAVFAAYGWSMTMTDQELLAELLALNLSRP